VQAARPARSHPRWEDSRRGDSSDRRALVAVVAQQIHAVAANDAGHPRA